jgi:Zn-finger nucleic acid-binding protein
MRCPNDGTALVITHRQRVEIDYCPNCRGVWLDRGELDKLIELTLSAPVDDEYPRRQRHDVDDAFDPDEGAGRFGRRRGKKRRESILGDLFDFG